MSEKLGQEALQPPRGMRDYPPAEAALRKRIAGALTGVFELYGFEPFDTPALENWEVLSSKYGGGEEILKETYSLKDLGDRKLGLRFDLTVPLGRFVAANPRIPLPFKRYQTGSVWRDGPVKLGRYREFWQADADTVGAVNGLADAELLALALDAFDALGLDAVVKVNNRKIIDGVLEASGVDKDKWLPAILSIDKLEKIGESGVMSELIEERGLPVPVAERVLKALRTKPVSNEDKLTQLGKVIADRREGRKGLKELEEVLGFCREMGLGERIVFTPSLARGLSYYTGTVFEVYLEESKIVSSVAAGGRYDELIGIYSGNPLPAVGISFGADVIAEALKERESTVRRASCRVLVIPIKNTGACLSFLQALRREGVAASIDLMERSLSKNLEYASKQGIPFAAIIGEKEVSVKKITLRDLSTGVEKLVPLQEAVRIISGK